MNRTQILLLWIFTVFTSCNGFGPIDSNIQTKNVQVSSKDIVGTWEMDTFSYQYFSDVQNNNVRIAFNTDYRFKLSNSHLLFDGEIDNHQTEGNWKIIKYLDNSQVELNFDKNRSRFLEIYKKEENYQLWYFLSDPDSGDRIKFLKASHSQ